MQAAEQQAWRCGTLTYGKAGLAMLFGWLLWGDFCFTIMEQVVPTIIPLKLKALGAPNWLMGVILTMAPGVLNMTICPWVSFKSDRYRSRWGRRIPFIVATLPFLALFLGLLGWSDDLTALLQRVAPALRESTPATLTILLIFIFVALFKFFDMFVNSVFWYLFNDVVPARFLGTFMGSFRIVGMGAGALYNWFIFKHAETHMREIFTGVALLYLFGFGLMCLMVKEGQYPPIEGENDRNNKGWGGISTFFRECFSHKFYWYRFIATASGVVGVSIGVFGVFFSREMGLTLEMIGQSLAITAVATMVAVVFMAVFVDRWHPLRLIVYAAVFGVIGYAGIGVWLFVTLPGVYFFWIGIGGTLAGVLLNALAATASLPCEMRIFPRSRFGQFCSAQAMLRSACTAVFGVIAGLFIDLMKWLCGGSDFAYRFNFVWSAGFAALSAFFMVKVYREWHRMGGDRHFHPPAPWSPTGIEEMPVTPTVGPQSRWLLLALRTFDGVMALSALCVPVMAAWMIARQEQGMAGWYLGLLWPLSLLAWYSWARVKRSIVADMAAAKAGRPLRNGIPHHGMLVLIGSQYLLLFGIWIAEVVVTVRLGMPNGALAFGVARVITNFLLIGAVWLICRIERGYSNEIDQLV